MTEPEPTTPRLFAFMGYVFALTLAGCGGADAPSPRWPPSSAPAQATVTFDDYAWQERGHAFARSAAACAQSIVYETRAAGYRWGEVVVIEAHTDHKIAGQGRIDVGGKQSLTLFSSEPGGNMSANDTGDNRRCQSAATPGGSVSAARPTSPPSVNAPLPSGSTARALPIAITFDASIQFDARVAVQILQVGMQHDDYEEVALDGPPVAGGVAVRIELWGMGMIDWTGVTLEIRSYEIIPKDPVGYRKRIEDKRLARKHPIDNGPHIAACRDRLGAPECADVRVFGCQRDAATLSRSECADVKKSRDDAATMGESTSIPPPRGLAETPPPKPSQNAVWVSGHWVFAHAAWSFWSSGFWRVDPIDLTQNQTATAPSAPPPPKVEPQAQQPSPAPGAVWTPGYWHWSTSWQWFAGAWRIPPVPAATWHPARWHADVNARGSFRLDPGGWLK
jgi:hypothetical protein